MKKNNNLLKTGVLIALAALSAPVNALEKPQTMEDMWKIINLRTCHMLSICQQGILK